MSAPRNLLLTALLALHATPAPAQNIVVVVMDDVGIDRIGDYQWWTWNTAGPTPNIDALAAAGVRFDNFWSYPVCSPARATILTGAHPTSHGVGANVLLDGSNPKKFEGLPAAHPNMANVLAANGYRTAAVGKWHLAGADVDATQHPMDAGFQYYAGSLANPILSVTGLPAEGYSQWEKCVNGVCSLSNTYLTTDTTDEAIAQLGGSEPFFLYVAYNSAHRPFHDPPAHLHSYDGQCVDETPAPVCHKAMIEALDTELGRLIASVDPTDTTLFLLSDNGSPESAVEAPFEPTHAKGTLYQGGVRVPLIVVGQVLPLWSQGAIADDLVEAADLFATIMDIAGVSAAAPDSVSFRGYLQWLTFPSQREHIYTEGFLPTGGPPTERWRRSARNERYKLIRDPDVPLELYDLVADPFETFPIDLADANPNEQAAYEELADLVGLPEPGGATLLVSGIVFLRLLVKIRLRPRAAGRGDGAGAGRC